MKIYKNQIAMESTNKVDIYNLIIRGQSTVVSKDELLDIQALLINFHRDVPTFQCQKPYFKRTHATMKSEG